MYSALYLVLLGTLYDYESIPSPEQHAVNSDLLFSWPLLVLFWLYLAITSRRESLSATFSHLKMKFMLFTWMMKHLSAMLAGSAYFLSLRLPNPSIPSAVSKPQILRFWLMSALSFLRYKIICYFFYYELAIPCFLRMLRETQSSEWDEFVSFRVLP